MLRVTEVDEILLILLSSTTTILIQSSNNVKSSANATQPHAGEWDTATAMRQREEERDVGDCVAVTVSKKCTASILKLKYS